MTGVPTPAPAPVDPSAIPAPVDPSATPAPVDPSAAAIEPIEEPVVGVGGSRASEYVKAAAFLGGAIAYLPLASAWLGAVGNAYYDRLLNAYGYGSAVLDLSDRMYSLKGYEIVVEATNPLIPGALFALPAALLSGVILGFGSTAIDYRRKAKGKKPILGNNATKFAKVISRVSYAIATLIIAVYTAVVIVYLSPETARNAADATLQCVMGSGLSSNCGPIIDYGDKAPAARLLVADKSHLYVYQDMSVRKLKLDDVPVTYAGKRPKPAPAQQ
ncbi:hypothetical protein [Sphingomonas sp. UMB7805-LC452B]|nr:hypothetical protein [Sphingomonas sp. UMB7805-LC452B]MDK8187173.1 hypothetical protein [Sphingomonas zeae]MDK8216542.1 hypothetical protein [Sphingomonas sp. UMB7805-LC452B]